MADGAKPEPKAETKIATAVKGISQAILKSLKPNIIIDKKKSGVNAQKNDNHKGGASRASIFAKSIVTNIALRLDLEEYEFPDEDEVNNPAKIEAKLDVTALDRYNEDVRRLRRLLIESCRKLPQRGDPDEYSLGKIKLIVRALCRTAFYGTHKALRLAEGAVMIITWLLNRRNIKASAKVHILQSFAEMVWTSLELKLVLYKCRGVRVIARLLVNGIKHRSDQCRWACYTLTMSCISSTEAIAAVLEIEHIDEVVGEIAFYSYWVNWPANFGSILQGILFGPHSVIAMEDTFDFI